MPYILKPRKIESDSRENWVWVQKATATKPVAYALEIWGGYEPEHYMTATQVKQWKGLSWNSWREKSLKKTVAAYKKKGYVVFEPKDCVKLFKEYVPRSYAAAVKSKKIGNRQSAESWAEYDAPMNYIWDKPSAVSVYNKFLKSMTWGGKKPKHAPKSPASYFWGWDRPLDFSDGFIGVIPSCYGSESVVLHNYKTGKVAVVTQCAGNDDEAGEYAMSAVAFEWKLNPKLVAAMSKPIMSGKGQQYVMKGTGRGVKKPAKPKATKKSKPKAKAKTGRKAPTISATKRKIGTRMRGNDGKMWEVKKSGKSQRWMAGAESFGAETFEAPKTMTKTQAKNKFIALAQPYWIKALTKLKEGYIQEKKDDDKRRGGESEYFEQYDYDIEDTNTYLKIAKSQSKIMNIIGCDDGDTVLREMIPDGFYHLINYPREDLDTWETTMAYFEGPKAIQKQLKALLPFIEGKVTVKPKAKKTTTRKSKAKAKPKAKPKTKKTTTKAKPKPKTKYILGRKDRPTDLKKRKSPPYSAKQFPKGARKKGNNGKMWTIVTDKRGVKRWKA